MLKHCEFLKVKTVPPDSGYCLHVHRSTMACCWEITLPMNERRGIEAATAALDEVARLEDKLSIFRPASVVSLLNQNAAQQAMPLEPELFALLQLSQQIQREEYDDWQEMLQKEDLEAGIIATPLWSHADIAAGCMEAGKHVLCEKMIANSLRAKVLRSSKAPKSQSPSKRALQCMTRARRVQLSHKPARWQERTPLPLIGVFLIKLRLLNFAPRCALVSPCVAAPSKLCNRLAPFMPPTNLPRNKHGSPFPPRKLEESDGV
jgi:Oxidoreductase family, NAD-binding Rossmann fold/ApbE family